MNRCDLLPAGAIRFVLALCLAAFAPVLAAENSTAAASLQILDLRCEYRANPLGIDAAAPRLSWRVASSKRGAAQTAWRVLVASSAEALARGQGDLWDSGRRASNETQQIAYAGAALHSRQLCHWKVQVWDEDGNVTPWSSPATWTMGLNEPDDWKATWISWPDKTPVHADPATLYLPPAQHFRRDFTVGKPVRRATVYASGFGMFDLHLNGKRVSEAYFEPGWSDYLKRAYYRAHDVTDLLRKGDNAIGAILADGWYAGYVGLGALKQFGVNGTGRYNYGKTPALLVQLEIEYEDGTVDRVLSDEKWSVTTRGPVREADLFMGESYDARKEMPGWDAPGFSTAGWEDAVAAAKLPPQPAVFIHPAGNRTVDLAFHPPARLQSYAAPPIVVTQELGARSVTRTGPESWLFDFGQNFAGNVRLHVRGSAGTVVKLRYGERLYPDGRLMTENLRKARATDAYCLRGDPAGEVWTPRFTYHGFQYVELNGLAAEPARDTLTGLVIHNDTPLTGHFECSDEVMSKFAQNVVWTQRSNFVEIPTDCPQRDERLGWTGDAQVYVGTAAYNADVAAFFTKWLDDLVEAQHSFGAYPDFAPVPSPNRVKGFGTAWGDAGVICPWTIWRAYDDTTIIRKMWPSMSRFMAWRFATTTRDGLSPGLGNEYGDWLNQNDPTPTDFIDTCYFARTLTMMAEMADAIGHTDDAARYRLQFEGVRAAFEHAYLQDGKLREPYSQTACTLALWSELLPEPTRDYMAARLVDKITANNFRMSTGFLGTRSLLSVLSAHGQHEAAVRLFVSRKFPSWGYEVANGANSVWERWDSFTVEHGFNGQSGNQNAAMNSFNHYALGAVMEWAYKTLAGIETAEPGFGTILIHPRPPLGGGKPAGDANISWVKAEYASVHGLIKTEWHLSRDRYSLDVTVPANTQAKIWLPAKAASQATESGQPLGQVVGVRVLGAEDNGIALHALSGTYSFIVELGATAPNG